MDQRNIWTFDRIAISIAFVLSLVAAVCAAISVRMAYNAIRTSTEVVSEAKRQAPAGQAQTRIAEDSERRRLRAYLGLSSTGNAVGSLLPPNVGTIKIGLRNYGQ